MPAIELRDATPADAGAIAALWHAAWMDGHDGVVPEEVKATRDPASFRVRTGRWISDFRVATVGPMLAGFYLCKENEVNQFHIASQMRGSGFAATLMADAAAHLRANGHRTIWLACAIGNDRARRFYEKVGWVLTGTQEVPLETATDPIPMTIWRFEKAL